MEPLTILAAQALIAGVPRSKCQRPGCSSALGISYYVVCRDGTKRMRCFDCVARFVQRVEQRRWPPGSRGPIYGVLSVEETPTELRIAFTPYNEIFNWLNEREG
jgi:hypothetical protein